MVTNSKWFNNYPYVSFIRWFALWCTVILASGCATAELSQRTVNEPAERRYQYIHVDVDLSDAADTAHLTNRFLKELDLYDLQAIVPKQTQVKLIYDGPGTAILKIDEVDRRTVTVKHRQRYGRTSLTQMRGRKKHDTPVITLRVTLTDTESGQTVFQADYVTQGPWYADSATAVETLAGTLVEQLEHEGFIAAK